MSKEIYELVQDARTGKSGSELWMSKTALIVALKSTPSQQIVPFWLEKGHLVTEEKEGKRPLLNGKVALFSMPIDINQPSIIKDSLEAAERAGSAVAAVPVIINDNHFILILRYRGQILYLDPKGNPVNSAVSKTFPDIKIIHNEKVLQKDATHCGDWVAILFETVVDKIANKETLSVTDIVNAAEKKANEQYHGIPSVRKILALRTLPEEEQDKLTYEEILNFFDNDRAITEMYINQWNTNSTTDLKTLKEPEKKEESVGATLTAVETSPPAKFKEISFDDFCLKQSWKVAPLGEDSREVIIGPEATSKFQILNIKTRPEATTQSTSTAVFDGMAKSLSHLHKGSVEIKVTFPDPDNKIKDDLWLSAFLAGLKVENHLPELEIITKNDRFKSLAEEKQKSILSSLIKETKKEAAIPASENEEALKKKPKVKVEDKARLEMEEEKAMKSPQSEPPKSTM